MVTLPKGFQNQLLLVYVHRSLSAEFCLLDTAAVQLGAWRGLSREPRASLSRECKSRSCPDLEHQLKTIGREHPSSERSADVSLAANAAFLSSKEDDLDRLYYGGVALRCMLYNSVLNFVCVDLLGEEEEEEFVLPANLTSDKRAAVCQILATRNRKKRLAVDALRKQQFCSIMNRSGQERAVCFDVS